MNKNDLEFIKEAALVAHAKAEAAIPNMFEYAYYSGAFNAIVALWEDLAGKDWPYERL